MNDFDPSSNALHVLRFGLQWATRSRFYRFQPVGLELSPAAQQQLGLIAWRCLCHVYEQHLADIWVFRRYISRPVPPFR